MGTAFITCAALLFYSTSKYFPEYFNRLSMVDVKVRTLGGVLLGLLGFWVLSFQMDGATAFIAWLVMFMTILPSLIFSLSLRPETWIGWMVFSASMIILDLTGYAS